MKKHFILSKHTVTEKGYMDKGFFKIHFSINRISIDSMY